MKNNEHGMKNSEFVSENVGMLICLLISITYFIFLISNSRARPLNVDDFAQINFVRKGISLSEIYHRLISFDAQPPLISIVMGIWIRVIPFDLQILKVPSEIMVSITVFLCGICGMKLRNITTGIVTSILAATSLQFFLECSFSLRPYGMVVLAGAVVVLCYINRNEKVLLSVERIGSIESKRICSKTGFKQIIIYGIGITFAIYTHYFCVIICGLLFFMDIILYLKKRIYIENIISYIIAGVCFMPWVIFGMIPSAGKYINNFWPERPTLKTLKDFYTSFCNGKESMAIFFTVCLIVIIIYGIYKIYTNKFFDKSIYTYFLLGMVFFLMIGFVFVYSAYVKPKASIFVFRYFTILLPIFFLLVASGFDILLQMLIHLLSKINNHAICVVTIGIFSALLIVQNYNFLVPRKESYEQSAYWLRQQEDIHNNDVLMLTTYMFEDGFNYVLTENWQLDFPLAKNISVYNTGSINLKGINKVYVIDDFIELKEVREAVLGKDFKMVKDYPEMNLEVYVRN